MVKNFWVSLRNSIVKFLNIFIRFQVASNTSLGEQNLHLHTIFGLKNDRDAIYELRGDGLNY